MTNSSVLTLKRIAMQHLLRVLCLFLATFAGGVIGLTVADWAEVGRGWQSGVVELIFRLVGGLSLLSSVIFGIMVWAWFSSYKGAINSANLFDEDPEAYRRSFGDVVGPISW